MSESKILTQTKSKIEMYEKGLNIIRDLILDFLKQDSLKSTFSKVEDAIQDIKTSAESMASAHQEESYLEEYFGNKFDHLKSEAMALIKNVSQEELRRGGQKAQEYIQTSSENVKKQMQANPMVTVAIAASLGVLISNMLRSK